jgi:hypothetical protein
MAETIEQNAVKVSLFPRWAIVAVVVMLFVGIGIGVTRETRTRSGAVAMLNGSDVRLVARAESQPITDGYEEYFGRVVLRNNHRAYDELLGDCASHPERAQAVFRAVMKSGTWQGKALACHMAFYLAQADHFEVQDLEAMAELLADPAEELRRVAQSELGTLLVVRSSTKSVFEVLGPPPPNLKERFTAAAVEADLPLPAKKESWKKGDWFRMKWSCPEACLSWWKAFGAQLKWDTDMKRFTLSK